MNKKLLLLSVALLSFATSFAQLWDIPSAAELKYGKLLDLQKQLKEVEDDIDIIKKALEIYERCNPQINI